MILLAVVATSSTAIYLASDTDAGPGPAHADAEIGYYALDARLMGIGQDGKPNYDLTAERVTQALADGSVDLKRVHVNYAPPAGAAWGLVADTGRISAGADIIELDGNVAAASADAGGPTTTFQTDFLRYDPATGVAETDRPVTVLYASSVVHARGLRAFLREGRLELLGQVRGRYDP